MERWGGGGVWGGVGVGVGGEGGGGDFFVQAEDGIRDRLVTGVQTCALPIFRGFGIHFSTVQASSFFA